MATDVTLTIDNHCRADSRLTYHSTCRFWVKSQDITNNTTTIGYTLSIQGTNTISFVGTPRANAGIAYIYVGGQEIANYAVPLNKGTGTSTVNVQKSGEKTISHNADGSIGNVAVQYNLITGGGNYSGDTWVWEGGAKPSSLTPATIPRATTPTLSASSIALGGKVTINLPRASSSFTHNVTYKFGSTTGTISSSAGTSVEWTAPTSLANQIPNSTSGTCTITVQTKNGSTVIGTKSINLTLTAPSGWVPTISTVTLSDSGKTSDGTAISTKIGAYVKGKSIINVAVSASGSNSSSISSTTATYNGATKSVSGTTVLSSPTTSGTNTVTANVKDSRGRTASKSATCSVLDYSAPVVSSFSATRCNSDGTANAEGTSVKLAWTYNIVSLNNKNNKSLTIQYLNGSTWTNITTTAANSAYSGSGSIIPSTAFSTDNSYQFRAVVTDSFGSNTAVANVDPSFALINFGANGKSLGIGQVSSNAGSLEVNLPTQMSNFTNHTGPTQFNNLTLGMQLGVASQEEGYVKIVRIKAIAAWAYGPVNFTIGRLQTPEKVDVGIAFSGQASPENTVLGDCWVSNSKYMGVHIHTVGNGVWDIYVYKQPGSYSFVLYNINCHDETNEFEITYPYTLHSSLPSGARQILAKYEVDDLRAVKFVEPTNLKCFAGNEIGLLTTGSSSAWINYRPSMVDGCKVVDHYVFGNGTSGGYGSIQAGQISLSGASIASVHRMPSVTFTSWASMALARGDSTYINCYINGIYVAPIGSALKTSASIGCDFGGGNSKTLASPEIKQESWGIRITSKTSGYGGIGVCVLTTTFTLSQA